MAVKIEFLGISPANDDSGKHEYLYQVDSDVGDFTLSATVAIQDSLDETEALARSQIVEMARELLNAAERFKPMSRVRLVRGK